MPEPENPVEVDEIKNLKLNIELPEIIPGKELNLQVSYEDTVPQLKETLQLISNTEKLTNFTILYHDIDLGDIDETNTFQNILELLNLGEPEFLNLKIFPKPYTLTDIYVHLMKFRQILGLSFLDTFNNNIGICGGSSTFNQLDLSPIKVEESESKPESEDQTRNISDDEKLIITKISECLTSSLTKHDISKFGTFDFNLPLKSLNLSQWSVPPFRKNKGDLVYLTLQTLEGEIYHITCNYAGFFVNKSTNNNWNPESKFNQKYFLIYDLVKSISPVFEKVIEENKALLHSKTDYTESYLIPSSFVNYPWLVDPENIKPRPDFAAYQSLANGVDGADIIKDWNEEFQSLRDLRVTSIDERILRERMIHKVIFDFNKTATETVINIVHGNIVPMNVTEDPSHSTYLRNGIFYSYAVDATGIFGESGGDEAARYTSGKDLNAVRLFNRIDTPGVHNLLTCVVDYMGRRMLCQAPVPGIFSDVVTDEDDDSEEPDKVTHGLSANYGKILCNEDYNKSLQPIADALHLKTHTVELPGDVKSEGKITTSKDMKGINGTDNRKYVIDSYRSTPIDIYFLEQYGLGDNEYPHKEVMVRFEAVDEWWKRKIASLFKSETEKLEKEGKTFDKKDVEKPQLLIQSDQVTVNADAFTGINESKEDQDEVRELSSFIKILIEELLNDFKTQVAPFDGSHLCSMLHRSGINLRYLGFIASKCLERKDQEIARLEEVIKTNENLIEGAKEQEKEKDNSNSNSDSDSDKPEEKTSAAFESTIANYDSVYRLAVHEMISRSVKHLLRNMSKSLPAPLLSHFVSHFFNCLLGSAINERPFCLIDEDLKFFYNSKHLDFIKLSSISVTELIEREVLRRFRYDLPPNWMKELVNPFQLFRAISIGFGIQWRSRNYVFTKEEFDVAEEEIVIQSEVVTEKKNKRSNNKGQSKVLEKKIPRSTVFISDDIIGFVPKVKDSTYRSSLLDEILETSRGEMENNKQNGLLLYTELLSFYEQIYGKVHTETANYYGILSQVYYDLNLQYDSCSFSRIGTILNQRVFGCDSFNAITSLINAAYFESKNQDYSNALKLYQAAIGILKVTYGDNHPSFVTTYANLGETLTNLKLFSGSKKLFEKSIDLSIKLNGEVSEVTALIRYRFGYSLVVSGNYLAAKTQFQEASNTFSKLLGLEDLFSKRSSTFVTNISNYLEVQKREKNKNINPVNRNDQQTKGKLKSKKKSKTKPVQINEGLASQSVEDILNYIEGPGKS